MEYSYGRFATPTLEGDYPESLKRALSGVLPEFTPDEKAMLKGSADFLGLNHYFVRVVREPSEEQKRGKGLDSLFVRGGDLDVPKSDIGWTFVPWSMGKVLEWLHANYPGMPIHITESGYPLKAAPLEESLKDRRRIEHIHAVLTDCHRAITAGVNLQSYFAWTFMDNFEWGQGHTIRFGLHHVDFDTLERTPKDSARWYAGVIARNGLEDQPEADQS
jgi:beta-glucosidase